MSEFKNTMDVFKLLEKTNCRKCNKPTCLAFAAAVFQGQIPLSECPFISEDILNKYGSKKLEYESAFEQDYIKVMAELKDQINQIDLESRAEKLGGKFFNGRLVLKILGKDFGIGKNGGISTDIHVNPWIV
ncbi:MAG: Fe-S cluster protein, partial [Desulfobacula sp.]|nr:Fe-S cluster protein [Desulfobacula sp.]